MSEAKLIAAFGYDALLNGENMPVTFYTKAEHDQEVGGLKHDNLVIAKLYCEVRGLPCTAANMGQGYCWECPVESWCGYEYKRYPK